LIDLLSTLVVLLKLDTTFMGLTVLGVGNALPDALTTIALAKKGKYYFNSLKPLPFPPQF